MLNNKYMLLEELKKEVINAFDNYLQETPDAIELVEKLGTITFEFDIEGTTVNHKDLEKI